MNDDPLYYLNKIAAEQRAKDPVRIANQIAEQLAKEQQSCETYETPPTPQQKQVELEIKQRTTAINQAHRLSPCPICGKKVHLDFSTIYALGESIHFCSVVCNSDSHTCSVGTREQHCFRTVEEFDKEANRLIEMWNKGGRPRSRTKRNGARPCPICGEEAIVADLTQDEHAKFRAKVVHRVDGPYFIHCKYRHALVQSKISMADALHKWNG